MRKFRLISKRKWKKKLIPWHFCEWLSKNFPLGYWTKKGKLADSQSMTNQKWKLIIGHMGTSTNRDRARDELWFYERRRTSVHSFANWKIHPIFHSLKTFFDKRPIQIIVHFRSLTHCTINNTLLSIFVYW